MIESAIAQVTQHWEIAAIVAAFLAKVINALTPHLSAHTGWRKALLMLVDVLDLIRVPDAVKRKPSTTAQGGYVSDRMLYLLTGITLLCALVFALSTQLGCAGTWKDQLRKGVTTIVDVAETTEGGIVRHYCEPQAAACEAGDAKACDAAESCAKYLAALRDAIKAGSALDKALPEATP